MIYTTETNYVGSNNAKYAEIYEEIAASDPSAGFE